MAFIWLRRARRILIQKDHSDVALKHGEAPANQAKWALTVGLINLVAGGICIWIIIGVPAWIATGTLIGPFQEYDSWSAVAGITIWAKIFADFLVKMQAHPFKFKLGKKNDADG